jgi:hypothetical protein
MAGAIGKWRGALARSLLSVYYRLGRDIGIGAKPALKDNRSSITSDMVASAGFPYSGQHWRDGGRRRPRLLRKPLLAPQIH